MRVRKKPWAEAELGANPLVISPASHHFGKWNQLFQNQNPIHVEIGCGKGGFLIEAALKNPDINFIGIERQTSIAAVAARKAIADERYNTANIRFICTDVKNLADIFDCGEIQRIYIHFCDPWPKKKWAKRRLTHHGFLNYYESLMPDGSEVFFKTDNRDLFEFSLNEFCAGHWQLSQISLDLHANHKRMHDDQPQPIMTEYERKFSDLGFPIYRLEARKNMPQ